MCTLRKGRFPSLFRQLTMGPLPPGHTDSLTLPGRLLYIQTVRRLKAAGRALDDFRGFTVAATSRNVKSMLKSRKLQSRKARAFMVNVAAFDGSHVTPDKKRAQKKKNFKLARRLMDNYSLPE